MSMTFKTLLPTPSSHIRSAAVSHIAKCNTAPMPSMHMYQCFTDKPTAAANAAQMAQILFSSYLQTICFSAYALDSCAKKSSGWSRMPPQIASTASASLSWPKISVPKKTIVCHMTVCVLAFLRERWPQHRLRCVHTHEISCCVCIFSQSMCTCVQQSSARWDDPSTHALQPEPLSWRPPAPSLCHPFQRFLKVSGRPLSAAQCLCRAFLSCWRWLPRCSPSSSSLLFVHYDSTWRYTSLAEDSMRYLIVKILTECRFLCCLRSVVVTAALPQTLPWWWWWWLLLSAENAKKPFFQQLSVIMCVFKYALWFYLGSWKIMSEGQMGRGHDSTWRDQNVFLCSCMCKMYLYMSMCTWACVWIWCIRICVCVVRARACVCWERSFKDAQ